MASKKQSPFILMDLPDENRIKLGSKVWFGADEARLVWTGKCNKEWFCVVDFQKAIPGGSDGLFDKQRLYHSKSDSCLLMSANEIGSGLTVYNIDPMPTNAVTCSIEDDFHSLLYQHNHLGCAVRVVVSKKQCQGRLCWCGKIDGNYFVVVELKDWSAKVNSSNWSKVYDDKYPSKCVLLPESDVLAIECSTAQQESVPIDNHSSSSNRKGKNADIGESSRKLLEQNKKEKKLFVFCDLPQKRIQLHSWMRFFGDKCRLVWTGKWDNDYYCVVDFMKSYPGGSDGVFDGQRLYYAKKEDSCLLTKWNELDLDNESSDELAENVISGVSDDDNSILNQHNHLGCNVRVRVSGKEVEGRLCWYGTVNGSQFIVAELKQSILLSTKDISQVFYFHSEKTGFYHLVPVSDIVDMQCLSESKPAATTSTCTHSQNKANHQTSSSKASFVFCDWSEIRLQLRSWMRFGGENCRLVWTGKWGDDYYFVVEFTKAYLGGTDGVFDGQRLYHAKKNNSCLLVKPDHLELIEEHWGKLPGNVISCAVDDESSLLYNTHLGCLVRVRVSGKEMNARLCWCGTVKGVHHVVVELEQEMVLDNRYLHTMFYFNSHEENKFVLLPVHDVLGLQCSSQGDKITDRLSTPSFQATDFQARPLLETKKPVPSNVQTVPPEDNKIQGSSKPKSSKTSKEDQQQPKLKPTEEPTERHSHQNKQLESSKNINEEDLFILCNLPQSRIQLGSRVYFGEFCGQLVWTGKRGQDWFIVVEFDDFVVDGTDGVFDQQRLYHSTRKDSCLLLKPDQMKPSRTAHQMSKNTASCAVVDDANSLLYHTHLGCAVRVRVLKEQVNGRLCWCGTVDGVYSVVVELKESITMENNEWPRVFYSLNEIDTYALLPAADVLWIQCTPPTINSISSPSRAAVPHTELDSGKFIFCDLPRTCRFYKLLLGSLLKYHDRHCNLVWTGKRDNQFFVLLDFGTSITNGHDGLVDDQRLYHATKVDSCLLVSCDHQHLHRVNVGVLPANAISCSVEDKNSILYQHTHLGCALRVRVSGIEVNGHLCWSGTVDGSPFVVVDLECSQSNAAPMLWKNYFVGSSGHHYAFLPSSAVLMKAC